MDFRVQRTNLVCKTNMYMKFFFQSDQSSAKYLTVTSAGHPIVPSNERCPLVTFSELHGHKTSRLDVTPIVTDLPNADVLNDGCASTPLNISRLGNSLLVFGDFIRDSLLPRTLPCSHALSQAGNWRRIRRGKWEEKMARIFHAESTGGTVN